MCSGLIIPDTILGGTVATMTWGVQWQDYVAHLLPDVSTFQQIRIIGIVKWKPAHPVMAIVS
jgi:hypothetical protein